MRLCKVCDTVQQCAPASRKADAEGFERSRAWTMDHWHYGHFTLYTDIDPRYRGARRGVAVARGSTVESSCPVRGSSGFCVGARRRTSPYHGSRHARLPTAPRLCLACHEDREKRLGACNFCVVTSDKSVYLWSDLCTLNYSTVSVLYYGILCPHRQPGARSWPEGRSFTAPRRLTLSRKRSRSQSSPSDLIHTHTTTERTTDAGRGRSR